MEVSRPGWQGQEHVDWEKVEDKVSLAQWHQIMS